MVQYHVLGLRLRDLPSEYIAVFGNLDRVPLYGSDGNGAARVWVINNIQEFSYRHILLPATVVQKIWRRALLLAPSKRSRIQGMEYTVPSTEMGPSPNLATDAVWLNNPHNVMLQDAFPNLPLGSCRKAISLPYL